MGFITDLFKSPSAPAAPDPSALAGAQSAANEETARLSAKLNRPDTYTPFGSVLYQDLGDDRWQVNQTLSPGMQGLLDQQIDIGSGVNDAALARVNSLDNTPFNLDGIGDYQSGVSSDGLLDLPTADSLDAYAQSAEDAAYQKFASRFDPQVDRDRAAIENRLANQGITAGSDAYSDEMNRFDQGVSDAREQAIYGSVNQGAALRSSLLADALTGRQQGLSERYTAADFSNQGRQQAINDRLLQRTQGLNEIAALIQGQQAIGTPTQQPMSQVGVAPPDIGGAYALSQNAQQNAYNQQMGSRNAAAGGLFGLGSAYILS